MTFPKAIARYLHATVIFGLVFVPSALPNELPPWEISDEHKYNSYRFRVHTRYLTAHDGRKFVLEQKLVIRRGGSIIHELSDQHVEIKPEYARLGAKGATIPIGEDVTGDGIPNLLVATHSGGAHCCYTYYVFQIGNEFRFVDKLGFHDSETSFYDVDGRPGREAVGADFNFAYWNAGFSETPTPTVVQRFVAGKYRVARDVMHQPPLPEPEFLRKAKKPPGRSDPAAKKNLPLSSLNASSHAHLYGPISWR